jgi:predicted O-methyltransferase YrrM
MRSIRRGLSAAAGLVSPNPIKRIEAMQVFLSYQMHRLPGPALLEHINEAPTLTAAHMTNARLWPIRHEMLAALPKGGRCAEVGTYRGIFSKHIAATCQPDEYHLFDIDFEPLDEEAIRAAFAGALHKHLGDSAANLRKFPAGYFDWLYIDADHSYAGVVNDLAAAHSVLKPGGYLMLNDYTNWDPTSAHPYGVAKAANEFILAENYEVVGLALDSRGFHDFLIRKPA